MTVRDGKTGAESTASFTLAVADALTVTQSIYSRVLPTNNPTSLSPIAISGGVSPAVTINPALPAGLSITSTGEITGTTSVETTSTTYTISVTDANNAPTRTLSLTLSTEPGPTVTVTVADRTVEQGKSLNYMPITATAPAGGGPLSYSVQPTLPTGLGLNSTNGQITGTPSALSPATAYTMTVKDGKSGAEVSKQFTLGVVTAFAYTQTTYNRTLKIGTATNFEVINFTGGSNDYGVTVNPALPNGLMLSFPTPASLTLSGTPTTASGQTEYQLTITDKKTGASATRRLTLTVNN
ncbi:Putative Ig domain [Edwardsiella tarda]|nr:Putative Ig domain [Edwardsiella tarda]